MISTILFDLDGTLLPMDQDVFVQSYFKELVKKLVPYGYEPEILTQAIWGGTRAMVKNDGRRSNEEVFWEYFSSVFGSERLKDRPVFEEFYRVEFQRAAAFCGFNSEANRLIADAKSAGYRVVLATNPLFPSVATESRIRWAGLEPSDFELYTTYENSCFCKPNPCYYREILQRTGAAPEECLMVGNDTAEDMVAETLGMSVFLLTDCLIHKGDRDISTWPNGGFARLRNFLGLGR